MSKSLIEKLDNRRKAIESQFSLANESIDGKHISTKSEIDDLEQLAQISGSRKKPKSKFDLRPPDMKDGPDEFGRPHISAIGAGIEMREPILIKEKDIISGKAKIMKPNAKELLNGISKLKPKDGNESNDENDIPIVNDEKDRDRQDLPIPPPPPLPTLHESQATAGASNTKHKKRLTADSGIIMDDPRDIQEAKELSEVNEEEVQHYNDKVDEVLSDYKTRIHRSEEHQSFDDDVRSFIAPSMPDGPTKEDWNQLFEIKRKREKEERVSSRQKKLSKDDKVKQKQVEIVSNKDDESDSKSIRSVARSLKSTLKNKTSMRKKPSSKAPSVCFSHPGGSEDLSEISDDDLVEANEDQKEYGTYAFICSELTIREPFVQSELNVLHAMCEEYCVIAELTFAKRRLFVKSMKHSKRVYNFLASQRRSGWLEKPDFSKAANNCKTLDFIFKRTLRRRSKKIEGYTLDLDGFRLNRVLDDERFERIMSSAFKRRDTLFLCTVGKMRPYTHIN